MIIKKSQSMLVSREGVARVFAPKTEIQKTQIIQCRFIEMMLGKMTIISKIVEASSKIREIQNSTRDSLKKGHL